jgi:hypothetical protein
MPPSSYMSTRIIDEGENDAQLRSQEWMVAKKDFKSITHATKPIVVGRKRLL